jgi:hypothetical protein
MDVHGNRYPRRVATSRLRAFHASTVSAAAADAAATFERCAYFYRTHGALLQLKEDAVRSRRLARGILHDVFNQYRWLPRVSPPSHSYLPSICFKFDWDFSVKCV